MTKNEREILQWLGQDWGVGLSSKTIALTAIGAMPDTPHHPHDPDDFGRCRHLLKKIPHARRGLEKLATDGGPVWVALASRWDDIDAQFEESERNCWNDDGKCYHLMRSIIEPAARGAGSVGTPCK
jgi:hypothetical protein